MKRLVIIDGYNLLFACPKVLGQVPPPWPTRKNMEAARYEMLALLARYQTLTEEELTIVFDGHMRGLNRTQDHSRLKILFAKSADAEIVRLVEKSKNPKGLSVVTSDRELRKNVRSSGANVISARAFLEEVDKVLSRAPQKVQKEPPEKFHGPRAYEVDYWLKIFASHPEDAQHPMGKAEEDDA